MSTPTREEFERADEYAAPLAAQRGRYWREDLLLNLARCYLALRERLAAVENWTHEHGYALVPSGPDTFGEGVRACKKQVAALLNRKADNSPLSVRVDNLPKRVGEATIVGGREGDDHGPRRRRRNHRRPERAGGTMKTDAIETVLHDAEHGGGTYQRTIDQARLQLSALLEANREMREALKAVATYYGSDAPDAVDGCKPDNEAAVLLEKLERLENGEK